jgi:N-acetylglucosaminyldiphosphoundecaprenol N-acetyl-beta-D-mannosaminyltransferase
VTGAARAEVGGVGIDAVDMAAAQAWLEATIAQRPRPGCRVSTINLDYLVLASRDDAFRTVLRSADLAVADGAPVIWLSRLGRDRLPGRVAGADLVAWLLDGGIPTATVFLAGSSDEVCRAVAARAERSGVKVVAWDTSPPEVFDDPASSQQIVRRVNASGAEILLTALGAPRQDMWMARHRGELDVSLMIGVGGSLDLAAGRLRRAPRMVQRMGLEWAFRMVQEPRRLWRRYLVDDLPFLAGAAFRALRGRSGR